MNNRISTNRGLNRMLAGILSIVLILTLIFSATGRAFAADEPPPFSLTIRAYIDGYSQLVIQGSNVYWHHIRAAAPGRLSLVDEPSYLNGAEWYPVWPNIPDAENRDCNCDSSAVSDLIPALPENPCMKRFTLLLITVLSLLIAQAQIARSSSGIVSK